MTTNRFYTIAEEQTIRFYQMPKVLFNNPNYEGLSLGAKAMYSILRDRLDLSIKNNWADEDGYIYLVFQVDDLAELIEMDRKTVMRYKKELVKYKLIVDKRMGQGKANRIYVLKPELPATENNAQTLDNTEKSQNGTSRSTEMGLQEVPKWDCNDTDTKETNKDIDGRMGEPSASQDQSPNNSQIDYEWKLFKDTCKIYEMNDVQIMEFYKIWRYQHPATPITTVLATIRELFHDQFTLKGNGWTRLEYKNITGLFHHRMKAWREMSVAYEDIDYLYESENQSDS